MNFTKLLRTNSSEIRTPNMQLKCQFSFYLVKYLYYAFQKVSDVFSRLGSEKGNLIQEIRCFESPEEKLEQIYNFPKYIQNFGSYYEPLFLQMTI